MGSGGETNTPGQILARASAEGQPARDADKTSSAPDDAAADDDGFAVGQRSFSLFRGGALAEQESLGVEFARARSRPNSAPSAAASAAQVSQVRSDAPLFDGAVVVVVVRAQNCARPELASERPAREFSSIRTQFAAASTKRSTCCPLSAVVFLFLPQTQSPLL